MTKLLSVVSSGWWCVYRMMIPPLLEYDQASISRVLKMMIRTGKILMGGGGSSMPSSSSLSKSPSLQDTMACMTRHPSLTVSSSSVNFVTLSLVSVSLRHSVTSISLTGVSLTCHSLTSISLTCHSLPCHSLTNISLTCHSLTCHSLTWHAIILQVVSKHEYYNYTWRLSLPSLANWHET